jgi:uncharacterized protein Yka (UPF0111/DUF47 family)
MLAPMFVVPTIESFKDVDGDPVINSIVNLNKIQSIRKEDPDIDDVAYDYYKIIFNYEGSSIEWYYPLEFIRDSDYLRLASRFKLEY